MNIYSFSCNYDGRERIFRYPALELSDAYERAGRKLIEVYDDLSESSYTAIERYSDLLSWSSFLRSYLYDHEGMVISDIREDE